MSKTGNIFDILSGSRLFRSLSPERRRSLASASGLARHQTGDQIFRLGEPASHVFLVVDAANGVGPVVQVQLGDGGGASFGVGEGELFGEIELLRTGITAKTTERVTGARLLRDAQVLSIENAALAEAAAAEPELRRRLTSQGIERLIGVTATQAQKQTLDPQIRFARGLLALLDDYGHVVGNRGIFDHRLSQEDLRRHFDQSLRWVSQRFSDWSPRGLIDTVPLALPDVARIELIGGLAPPGLASKFEQALVRLEAQVSAAMPVKAGQTAADLLSIFPGNPVAAFHLALANSRCGAPQHAAIILSRAGLSWDGSLARLKDQVRSAWRHSFGYGGGEDPASDAEASALDHLLARRMTALCIDIGALHARLIKEGVERSGDIAAMRQAASMAAMAYRRVSEVSPNHYCAANAASLSLVAGEEAVARRDADQACRLAAKEDGYWASASLAEALLVKGEQQKAMDSFEKARMAADADAGKLASTRRQMQWLARMTGLDLTRPLAVLDPGHALCFSGHIMRPTDGSAAELAEAEARFASQSADWLRRHTVAGVHMSMAAGADIIFAEQAAALDVPIHIALPLPVEEFCRVSVEIGNGPGSHTDWVKRYYACLDGAASLTELWRYNVKQADLGAHFASANRYIMGETLKRADLLATQPLMLAAVSADARQRKSFATRTQDEFVARGVLVDTLEWPLHRRAPTSASPTLDRPFSHVLFCFARSVDQNNAARAVFEKHGLAVRLLKDRRVAGHAIMPDVGNALATAHTVARHGDLLRVICDYGPVLGRNEKPVLDALLGLEAAGDMKSLTIGNVFATTAFAMDAIARVVDPQRFVPLGVGESDGTLRGAREVYLVTGN